MGYVDGAYIVNPTTQEQALSSLDLIVAGTRDAILMIEGYCDFLTGERAACSGLDLEAVHESDR